MNKIDAFISYPVQDHIDNWLKKEGTCRYLSVFSLIEEIVFPLYMSSISI